MNISQREINKMMGISDEVFAQYGPAEPEQEQEPRDMQRYINKLMGISDAVFAKYSPKPAAEDLEPGDAQRIVPKFGFEAGHHGGFRE